LLIPPKITKEPTIKQVQHAYNLLPTSDASILAAAISEKADALITWNTKDFMRKAVVEAVNFPILKPGEFLDKFLK
jgi:predicted nucleic acid-binding protein